MFHIIGSIIFGYVLMRFLLRGARESTEKEKRQDKRFIWSVILVPTLFFVLMFFITL